MNSVEKQPDMNASLSNREQLSFNLFSSDSDRYQTTLTYIVYRTIETNGSITLNQLKWLLHNELLVEEAHIDSVVAALTSKTLFNTISRWRDPKKGTMHLRFRSPGEEFSAWLVSALGKYPELEAFQPSLYRKTDKEVDAGA